MPGDTIGFEVIVGLGNPGRQYEETRHNAGFWFLDALARQAGVTLRSESRFSGELARGSVGGRTVYLLKPRDYMNRSGQAIASLLRFYRLPVDKMLVVHDELDLPPGHIRLKKGGGPGGHNGLRDTIASLGENGFWRLRIGIGHPGHKSDVAAYVLKRAPLGEQSLINEAVALALSEAGRIVGGDINEATKVLHSHKPTSADDNGTRA